MSGVATSLIVRRRDIEGSSPPAGGTFAHKAVTRLPVPRFVTNRFGVFCVDTAEPVVSLTYDDGPHPTDTPRLLDELALRQVRVTFFVLAGQVQRHPDITRRILAEGHEIGLHGIDHRSLLTLGDGEGIEYVRRAKRTVEEVTEHPLRLYRPPYGEHTPRQAAGIARLGLTVVIWSTDSVDWQPDTVPNVAERALATAFAGGIVLLHDNRGDPEGQDPDAPPVADRVAVLRTVLDGLTDRGYRTETVGGLLQQYPAVRSWARERMVRSSN